MWESRVAPLSGVLFAVFLAVGVAIGGNTAFMPSEDTVIAYFADSPTGVMVGAYFGLLAAAALVWFGGSLWASMRRFDDDGSRLSLLAFGGGVLAAGFLVVGEVVLLAGAERMSIVESLDPGAAAALFDISAIALGNAVPIGLAVLIGAAGLASIRSSSQYRWAGWVSILIALGLLSPFGWAALAAAIVWVPVAAIWIYRSIPAPGPLDATVTASETAR